MNSALIVLAHGSRRHQSNEEVKRLATALNQPLAASYLQVTHAFLELLQPDLSQAVADAVAAGAEEVVVYPFFLNTGNHVERDVPELMAQLKGLHPTVRFTLLRHFGSSEEILPLIVRHIREQ